MKLYLTLFRLSFSLRYWSLIGLVVSGVATALVLGIQSKKENVQDVEREREREREREKERGRKRENECYIGRAEEGMNTFLISCDRKRITNCRRRRFLKTSEKA